MTLYLSLVFAILVFEMVLFMTLILPLPFTWKRAMFTFISESPLVAKLQYAMKITFIFILILFVDSVTRVYKVQQEISFAKHQGGAAGVVAGGERSAVQARKFYSERNMYLCGFTLFLSLILNRTYTMIVDVLRLEEENKRLKGTDTKKGSSGLGEAGGIGEIGRLKKQIAEKDRNIEILRKQAQGLADEYNRVGDQVTIHDPVPKKDR